jgi:hypothetical protein
MSHESYGGRSYLQILAKLVRVVLPTPYVYRLEPEVSLTFRAACCSL